MNLARPLILGIETSCDDTGCSVVDGTGRVLSSVVSSQLSVHRPFGGVVPEIASREHLSNWPAVSREALEAAHIAMWDIDAVAVTRGPGLVGCLLVGMSIGRAIAHGLGRRFHGVHHLEGHIYSPFLSARGEPAERAPERFHALVVSGGHTSLLEVERADVFSMVETRDDAFGEVFDKVGKRLGLPYPQGPKVDELAERGTASKVMFRVPAVKQRQALYFSYSGLKSQALREIQTLEHRGVLTGEAISYDRPDEIPQPVLDLLASFRYSAVRQLLDRLRRHQDRRSIRTLAVSGGAAANRLLRRELIRWAEEARVNLRLVPLVYSGDNAAMIAFAALMRGLYGKSDDPSHLQVASRIPFV
ncbi:MAG: tRNA (adenosine(37)-N6)-threonylcarbamoyltransferase complex transferase subunit TsaD [Thermoanaerobaculia bacterium]|nr:tRNA (adenosine(37)-N6)-threonylcarbamoyltransferase complex transferase subunit TsaD [Thermoanaerobaculia bacterium]